MKFTLIVFIFTVYCSPIFCQKKEDARLNACCLGTIYIQGSVANNDISHFGKLPETNFQDLSPSNGMMYVNLINNTPDTIRTGENYYSDNNKNCFFLFNKEIASAFNTLWSSKRGVLPGDTLRVYTSVRMPDLMANLQHRLYLHFNKSRYLYYLYFNILYKP